MNITKITKNVWMKIITQASSEVLARKELENAKRHYLEYKTLSEYYQTLCSFEHQRISRLEKYLEPSSEPPP